MRLSDGLWLMNKAGLLQLEHFNKSNALSWAITMGLFAMPVVYSERDWNQIVGESYYIQLGPQDRFGGRSPKAVFTRLPPITWSDFEGRDLSRMLSVASGGRGMRVASSIRTFSKLRDFAITQEVLRSYGDMVKDTIRRECWRRCAQRVRTA